MNDSDEIHTSDEEEEAENDDNRVDMEDFVKRTISGSSAESQPEQKSDTSDSEEEFMDMKGWEDSKEEEEESGLESKDSGKRSKSLIGHRKAPEPPLNLPRADTVCGHVSAPTGSMRLNIPNPCRAAPLPPTVPVSPISSDSMPQENPITPLMKRIDNISLTSLPDSRMSERGSAPPPYKPTPILNGYLEEGHGDIKKGLKALTWHKRYVDYVGNCLKINLTREDSGCIGKSIQNLDAMFVSIQADLYIRLDGSTGSFVFRAQTQNQALQWTLFLSQQCKVAPSAEGYTMKESGRKKIMESRYLKLTAEGLLSWYTAENVAKPQNTIQLRGEEVQHKNKFVHVKIDHENRTYTFEFLTAQEATQWFNVMQWHAGRKKLEVTSVPTRKKSMF